MANSTWEQVAVDLGPKLSPARVVLSELERDANRVAPTVIIETRRDTLSVTSASATGEKLATWREGATFWCLGKTRGDTEAIRNSVMAHMHKLYPALVRFEGGEWSRPAWIHSGYAYGLDLTIDTIVPRAIVALADVLSVPFDTTGAVAGDRILQAGEG